LGFLAGQVDMLHTPKQKEDLEEVQLWIKGSRFAGLLA
jgi:hypothetical protein